MPSKNNKKLAAAERSKRLAEAAAAKANAEHANEEVDVPEMEPVDTSTTAPTTAPIATSAIASATTTIASSTPLTTELTEKSTAFVNHSSEPIVAIYKPPTRLAPLTKNQTLQVITNSYQMDIRKTLINRYDVSVTKFVNGKPYTYAGGERSDRKKQAALFELMGELIKKEGLNVERIAYDGACTLFSVDKINLKNNASHFAYDHLSPHLKKIFFPNEVPGSITVTLQENEASPTHNMADVLNENLNDEKHPTTQLLQIVLCQEAKHRGFTAMDRNSTLYQKGIPVQKNEAILNASGVAAGVKMAHGVQGKGAAHIVVDYTMKQFFAAGPLQDLNIKFQDIKNASEFLRGLEVGTTYSSFTFRIDGLSEIPMVDIVYEGGSVLDDAVQKSKKPRQSFNKTWPAVLTKIKERGTNKYKTLSFPIENLKICPNQKLMPKHGDAPQCPPPKFRFEKTKEVGEKARLLDRNKTLEEFGAKILPDPLKVMAVRVPIPTIVYNKMYAQPNLDNFAKWSIPTRDGASFIQPSSIAGLQFLYNSNADRLAKAKIDDLLPPLKQTITVLGMKIRKYCVTTDLAVKYPGVSVNEAIRKFMADMKNVQDKPIVVYVDHCLKGTHQVLKLQERLWEVPTQQLALDKSLKREHIGASTLTNIALKLNVKAGGLNHKVLGDPMISHLWGDSSNTLIISYDVCHSSGRVYRKGELCEEPACVGFAFNGTKSPEAIIGDFYYQMPRKEEVNGHVLFNKTKSILSQYVEARRKVPDNVIVLRDGVSEGQHKIVFEKEYPNIKQGVMKYLEEKKLQKTPKFAVFIVNKRHANRVYVGKNGAINNVPALTAIDQVIVKKAGNEMIFVPHSALKGTSQPIVINMIANENIFKKNDEVIRFMAALCCAHQSSTIIISLPETIYAADEYAKRGSEMFQTYKQQFGDSVLPMTSDGSEYDWDKISETLNYEKSIFKKLRIV